MFQISPPRGAATILWLIFTANSAMTRNVRISHSTTNLDPPALLQYKKKSRVISPGCRWVQWVAIRLAGGQGQAYGLQSIRGQPALIQQWNCPDQT